MPPDTSAILALPYLMPAQAQKHVTHNEALRSLDVVVQLAVLDRDRSLPPAGPAEGDRHIVAAGAEGTWAGHEGAVAAFLDGGWSFFAPRPGWRAEVLAEGRAVVWDGSAWSARLGMLGINTAADGFNRLAVSAPATLFTHEGAGHQVKVNKAAAGDTASLLFQSGWTGYAEMGLAGDTDFAIKVSDGTTWHEALKVNTGTGNIELTGGLAVTLDRYDGAAMTLTRASTSKNAGAAIQMRKVLGTLASPEELTQNTVIGQFTGIGFTGGAFSPGAATVSLKAAEDWGAGRRGTRFTVDLIAPGTTTRREVLTVEGEGRATLMGSEVLHQGNLLGAVAFSGGTPSGAAIERGSGADGSYVKFADGTLICTRAMAGSASAASTWSFPSAFAAAPVVSGAVQASVLSVLCLDAAPTTTAASFSLRDGSGRRADTVHLTAVGRWA